MQTEDGTLFLDMKCGNLMQQRITRIQTDQVCSIECKEQKYNIYFFSLVFIILMFSVFRELPITKSILFKANEIARLIRQYITIDQRMRGGENGEKQIKDEGGDDDEIHVEHNGEEKVKIITTY